jgi:long-subunit fatty acid transport protein
MLPLNRRITLALLGLSAAARATAADVYGSPATAQTTALGGISLGSSGPTDALADNPALLCSIGAPYLEITGMGIVAAGQFHNATPYAGTLQSDAGLSGSAAFGMQIPDTRLSFGVGVFPVSTLSDRWKYQDPPGTAGASYGIQSSKSAFIAVQPTFGLGFAVSKRLSAGAAFGVVDNFNALEAPYIFQTNPTLAGLKTLLDLHTSGIGYNGTFGVTALPMRRLQIGLAYKTRTSVHTTGTATGNAYAQFAALSLPYASDFRYKAAVDNVFPQTALVSLAWQPKRQLRLFLQSDWLNWHAAFVQLPVYLTDGNNALLNTLLHSTSLDDAVPLRWRNQWITRAGFEIPLGESFSLEGAYAHGNSPVPAATLTPLTAAIMTDTLSGGIGYAKNRYRVQLAYQANLPQTADVGNSALLAGEYNNTRTSVWLQTVALTTGMRF